MKMTKVWEQVKQSVYIDGFIKDLEEEIQAETDIINFDLLTQENTKAAITNHILKLNTALEILKDADYDSSSDLLQGFREEDTGLIGKVLASYMLETDKHEKAKTAEMMMWLLTEYAETKFALKATKNVMINVATTRDVMRQNKGDEQC